MIPASDRDARVLILPQRKTRGHKKSTPGILWLHGGGHLHSMYQKILLPHARLLVEKSTAPWWWPRNTAPHSRKTVSRRSGEDCYAALLFLKAHADELGINDAQIMVGGESAGGGLTVATCLLARDLGEVNVAFQMPLYPMLDDRETAFARQSRTRVEHAHQPICLETLSPRFRRHDATVLRRSRPGNQLRKAASCLHLRRHCRAVLLRDAWYVANLKRAGIEASVDVYPRWFPSREVGESRARHLYATEHYFAPLRKKRGPGAAAPRFGSS